MENQNWLDSNISWLGMEMLSVSLDLLKTLIIGGVLLLLAAGVLWVMSRAAPLVPRKIWGFLAGTGSVFILLALVIIFVFWLH